MQCVCIYTYLFVYHFSVLHIYLQIVKPSMQKHLINLLTVLHLNLILIPYASRFANGAQKDERN